MIDFDLRMCAGKGSPPLPMRLTSRTLVKYTVRFVKAYKRHSVLGRKFTALSDKSFAVKSSRKSSRSVSLRSSFGRS